MYAAACSRASGRSPSSAGERVGSGLVVPSGALAHEAGTEACATERRHLELREANGQSGLREVISTRPPPPLGQQVLELAQLVSALSNTSSSTVPPSQPLADGSGDRGNLASRWTPPARAAGRARHSPPAGSPAARRATTRRGRSRRRGDKHIRAPAGSCRPRPCRARR